MFLRNRLCWGQFPGLGEDVAPYPRVQKGCVKASRSHVGASPQEGGWGVRSARACVGGQGRAGKDRRVVSRAPGL